MRALSKEEQIREIIRCGKDPIYFIKTYAKIQHPVRGTVPFETYPFQDDCVNSFLKHRLNIILKSRQLGLSTICAAYATWTAIFQKDKNILVIATKLATAQNFIKKVATIVASLPQWLLLPKYEPSKQQITFSNGSQVKAIPTSSDAGRSEALSLLIIDEAAFIRDFDEIWTGLSPTVSTGGQAIILSTPNGVGGQYYRLWMEAESGANDFNPIRLPWDVHPEHDDDWFEKETRNLPVKKLSQEFLCDFVASGDTFLQAADIENIRQDIRPPIDKAGLDRKVWIWAQPQPDRRYVISGDVARGDARDFSAFHILDAETCEVAVEYMGKIPPEKFAELMFEWGQKYNNALACPENNTFGYFVNMKLKDMGYPKMYYYGHHADPWVYIPKEGELPGFPTSQKTRVQILTKLEELIRNKVLRIYSQRTYDQLQAFIWNGNKPMASKDSFDDLVMSLAIGSWLIEGNSGLSDQAVAMSYAILEATKLVRRDQSEIAGLQTQSQFANQQNIQGSNPSDYLRAREAHKVPGSDKFDLSWLYK